MTASQYQKEYQSATPGSEKAEAHKRLVGAERALSKAVAPIYFSWLEGKGERTDLKKSGEYDAYYAAWDTTNLDDETVKRLTP